MLVLQQLCKWLYFGCIRDCFRLSQSAIALRTNSFQGPLSRFGDTAANAGIFALLESLTWPVLVKTIAASLASATFRMLLTPIDTLKTTQQTQGGIAGLRLLRERIKEHGISCLFWGAFGTAGATFVGHCEWEREREYD
jgi:hypothetical protein